MYWLILDAYHCVVCVGVLCASVHGCSWLMCNCSSKDKGVTSKPVSHAHVTSSLPLLGHSLDVGSSSINHPDPVSHVEFSMIFIRVNSHSQGTDFLLVTVGRKYAKKKCNWK